jgi:transcriptional regulator with XRE-family HTH domain
MEFNAVDAHIGTRMRELREKRCMLLSDLARLLDVQPTELADFEAARIRVPAVIVYWYCRALGIEVKQVFEGLLPHVDATAQQRLGMSTAEPSPQ